MGKIRDNVSGFKRFFEEVQAEMKKCAWPSKPELVESTIVVIVATLLFGAFVGISDFGLIRFMGWIIR